MADIAEMTAQLTALKSARYSGALKIVFCGREVTYRSDKEMAAAISTLQAEIHAATGGRAVRNIVFRQPPNRGW